MLKAEQSINYPELPESFKVGQAIGGGDCFFDAVAQGLKRLKPEMDFTVKSLREVCKKFAQGQLSIDQSWLKETLKNENEKIDEYIPRIEFTADDINNKPETSILGLTSPIWGRPEVEGRIICKEYNVKLHVIEKHNVQGKEIWANQIVDESGSKSVDEIDYNDTNTIHIINRGENHFEPIQYGRQKSSQQQPLSDSNYQPKSGQERQPDLFRQSSSSKKQPLGPLVGNDFNQPVPSNAQQENRQPLEGERTGKQGLHGDIYQLKLLMLFLKRGTDNQYSFRLSTEKREAKKFDDLFFEITKDGKKEYRLLQAKHKKDKSKKITFDNLLTESDGDYSLVKYFFSYQDSKKEKLFKNGIIRDVTVCTNINLDLGDKYESEGVSKTIEEVAQRIEDSDSILDVDNKILAKEAVRYRFSDDLALLLKPKLEDYSPTRLARRLAECFLKNSPIQHHQEHDIFKLYHTVLAKEIIDVKAKKFHDKFIKNEDISEDTKKFRKVFAEEIKKQSKEMLTLEDINSAISDGRKIVDDKPVNLNLSKNFGKGEDKNWPNNVISDDEIKDFLNHLVFAVNQPDEKKLGEIVKRDIGKEFDFVTTENVYNALFVKMIGWLNGEGEEFISYEKAKEFFEEAKRGIPIWFDVKDPVSLFTGRKKELNELHNEIQRSSEKATVISQMTSISGLGGIGKTELARQYIRERSKDYYDNNVIWVNAGSEVALIESFHRLAKDKLGISTKDADGKEKDIKSIVEEVYKFFGKRKSLFIFDNAEKSKYLSKFLPRSLPQDANRPYILITSRDREWERGMKAIDLNELKLEDAMEIVKKGLGILKKDTSQDQEIESLVKKLQRFPLAIQQAIAYIADQRVVGEFEIQDYLKEYEKKAEDLLKSDVFQGIDNEYEKTTFTTWQITIDKIASNEQYGQLALRILDVIAYFAPENISREIFLSLAGDDEAKLYIKSAVRLLVQYSMINGEQRQSILSIHRLVQQVTRINLEKQNKEEKVLREALGLFKNNVNLSNVNHAVSAWNHANKYRELIKEFSKFPRDIVRTLDHSIRYEEAYLFGKKASKLLEKVLGYDHPDTLMTQHNIAVVLDKQGKYEEALKAYQEVFDLQKVILGPEHPDTLRTQHNIAGVLSNQGKYEEVLRVYQEVLDIQKRPDVLGPEHPDTLTTQHNMAVVLYNQGKYDEALNAYTEVLNIQKVILGPDHPDTLSTQHNMALVLSNQGKYDAALNAYTEVLNIQKVTLGPDHPDTLSTQHNMARVLDSQGKYSEALKIYQEVFEKRRDVLGPDHPDTLMTQHGIAEVLSEQGKYDEALNAYTEVLNKRKVILGPDHLDTLTTHMGIALVLSEQGKYDAALNAYTEVLNKRKVILGPDHPDTLSTQHNMARVLYKQGKYKEALNAYTEVLNIQKVTLGPDHPDTLSTQHNMALVLSNQGKYDAALNAYTEVLNIQKVILGPNHPDTLMTQHNIAVVLDKQGKYKEALNAYTEVLNKRKVILGPDHPNTLSTQHNMAVVLYNQGEYDKALNAYTEVLNIQKVILGPDHPDILTTNMGIATMLSEQGKYDEALNAYTEVLNKRKVILGPDHPDTLRTQHNMAGVIDSQGKYNEALKIYQEVFEKRRDVLGPDHPDTLMTQRNIAVVLCKQGKYEEALKACSEYCSASSDIESNKKQQKAFLDLSKFVSHHVRRAKIESVKQGLYLPSFESRNAQINGKCAAITRNFSQSLFLNRHKLLLDNLQISAELYERIVQGKQISQREEREIFDLSKLFDNFMYERQLDSPKLGSPTGSLPSSLSHIKSYKTLEDLSHYISRLTGDFAIHLVTNNHVVAIYRTYDTYAYFDSNVALVSNLQNINQLMTAVRQGVKYAGYKVEEKGFLVEHFDVDRANNLLSDKDKQILTKEIKTERQLLAEQDKKLGRIKIGGQKLSRVQLYDLGIKVNVKGSIPLLINADMNLSSTKFQDHLGKKEVSMIAREYLGNLKNSKNVKRVIQATRFIPFEGSKHEIEEAEQTRKLELNKLSMFLLEELIKGAINFIAGNFTTASPANISRSKSQLPRTTCGMDNKPESYLSGITIRNQQRSPGF